MPPTALAEKKSEIRQWSQVKKLLHTQFHFKDLRPGQEPIIRSVLNGKHTLAILPTGAGKSLCYQLPAHELKGMAIVISPLISLMKDQQEKVEEKGMHAVQLNSSISASTIAENLEEVARESAEILYVTPERFTNPEFIKSLEGAKINLVVIDEAHCVSQWGHDFRPAYLAVGETLKKLGDVPVLALTATATETVASDIQKQLGLRSMEVFRSSILRDNLQLEARYLNSPAEKMAALLKLVTELKENSGIIYTATVKAAEEIHNFLAAHEIESLLYHGKLKAKEREANQNEFMTKSPKLMIATNAFGMGIDKADIRFVIHFQFPGSLEAYYQEAGRAGRDGMPARCILLYLKRDKCTQSLFLSGKYPSAEEVTHVYQTLQALSAHPDGLTRARTEEKIKNAIAQKKNAVIFSLLKQLKIIKETKTKGLQLLKPALPPEEVKKLAQSYQERAEMDHKKLDQVIIYAQSALCRWRNLLLYFNETPEKEHCGHCDNCLSPTRREFGDR